MLKKGLAEAQVKWEGNVSVNLSLDFADLLIRGVPNSLNHMETLITKICSSPLKCSDIVFRRSHDFG